MSTAREESGIGSVERRLYEDGLWARREGEEGEVARLISTPMKVNGAHEASAQGLGAES